MMRTPSEDELTAAFAALLITRAAQMGKDASWHLPAATVAAIRNLKDADGSHLYDPLSDTLLGLPITREEYAHADP